MSEARAGLPVLCFADEAAFSQWLSQQTDDAPGLWLKLAKKASGVASVTRPEAVDAALCQGWIDGQADTYDDVFWLLRVTPRRARSKWSEINRTRAGELVAAGRMQPKGLARMEAAKADGRWAAAYAPQSRAEVPAEFRSALDANPTAAAFFRGLDARNRYAMLHRIATVKRDETRTRKIALFVDMLARGERIYDLGDGGFSAGSSSLKLVILTDASGKWAVISSVPPSAST